MNYKIIFFLLLATLGAGACASSPQPAPTPGGTKQPVANDTGKPAAGALSANDLALFTAANKGDNAQITELLGKGANVNAQNASGSTPLIEAVYNNHPATVQLLLDKGADPNKRKNDGATALGFAQKYPPIVQMLKAKGASIQSNPALDNELLVVAGKGDVAKAKELVDKGAYANYRDADGRAPIIEAAYNGHLEMVKFLLEKGADANARKNDGASALGFARKYPQIVEALKNAGAKE